MADATATRQQTPFLPRLRLQRLLGQRRHTNVNYNAQYYNEPLPWYCGQDGQAEPPPYLAGEERNMMSKWMKMSKKETPKKEVIIYKTDTNNSESLTSLFSHSSVPGLREISSSDHIVRKIFWFFAFLMLSFLALSDIHQLLAEFYSYPITVDVRLRESRKLPFPAVTVCNLNIVRYSALCNTTSNISIPIELKEKLCGIFSNNSNTNFSDINDINDINSAGITPTTTPSPIELPVTDGARPLERRKRQYNNKPGQNQPNQKNKQPGKGGTRYPSNPPGSPSAGPGGGPGGGGGGGGGGYVQTYDNGYQSDELELTEREEKEIQENLTTWLAVMANVDKDLTLLLGHQFEDMMLRCTMKSNNCTDPRNFESSFTPTEGNCYTYKSYTYTRKKKKKPIETSLAGVDHGLELVLNLEVNEYLPGTSQIGALVMVHSADDFGTTASEAIFVAPERATYIGLKMVNITRLPSPYPEHCVSHWPPGMTGSVTLNSSYSQQACLKICLQRTIERKCKCQSAMLPQLEIYNANQILICDTRYSKVRGGRKVMLRPESKVDVCQCPPRCQSIMFDKQVSLAKWPTREDRVSFDRGKSNVNFQNVAKVVVYFQTMTMQEVAQQKAWTTAKLFSSLGGFMGMYVGFSFLSLFEVFEVLGRRIWFLLTRKRPKFKVVAKSIAEVIKATKVSKRNVALQNRRI